MWAQAPGIQCLQLADVAPLGARLEKLQALTSLDLKFGGSYMEKSQLADVARLGAALEKLQALTSLNLNFWGCSLLSGQLQRQFDSKESFLAAVGA